MVKGHCLVEEEHLWHRISCSIKHIRWNITCNLDTKDMCTRKIDLSEVSQCPPNNNTQKAVALIGTAMLGLLTAWSDFIWVFLCLHSNLYHPNHPLLKVWWRVAHLFHIQETIATDVIPLPSVQKSMAGQRDPQRQQVGRLVRFQHKKRQATNTSSKNIQLY